MSNTGTGGGAPPPRVSSAARPGAVRLTQVAGGQFVLTQTTSQPVPPLTQISTIVTTSTALSQSGYTRVLNISSSPNRPTAVATASTVAVPSQQRPSTTAVVHQTIVNALAKPPQHAVVQRSPQHHHHQQQQQQEPTTSGVFVTPNANQAVSPARKRLKLDSAADGNEDGSALKKRILEHDILKIQEVREKYLECGAELFYLQVGGDMVDYTTWRKKPTSVQFQQFMHSNRLDSDGDNWDDVTSVSRLFEQQQQSSTGLPQGAEIKMTGVGVTPVAVSTQLPAVVAQLSQQGQVPGRPQGGRHGMVFAIRTPSSSPAPALVPGGTPLVPDLPGQVSSPGRVPLPTFSPDRKPGTSKLSAVSSPTLPYRNRTMSPLNISSATSQELIVEKAKQEAYVMQRIGELQREGLWSEKRLPKIQEPPRSKVHWDYLLEEMVWLSADFAQERKWKKAAAKKCARMVQKYFQDKAVAAQKAEKAQEMHLKRLAAFVAKEIRNFWSNVEKLVEFKQQTRLEEKRKQALDQHLSFIVDQTEKYSQLLAEGMNKGGAVNTSVGDVSVPPSRASSRIASPTGNRAMSDDEFCPENQPSSDDEETIAQAEAVEEAGYSQEVSALQRESEMDLDTLINELPPGYLENRDKIQLSDSDRESDDDDGDSKNGEQQTADEEFTMRSDKEESDVEDTIMEQEEVEGEQDHKKELDELKELGEMSIDDLMKMYGTSESMDIDGESADSKSKKSADDSSSSETENEEDSDTADDTDNSVAGAESDENSDSELESNIDSQDEGDDVGLKSLLDNVDSTQDGADGSNKAENRDELIDNAAALAESIQPKGNTLSSTNVVTKIPFLLKHSLREYQHIGLDWLVTMFDRKLNGILADEMGLGKTIQTIALLAHLACEQGDWGPHLIIVPTSVMLNWEMECKKWCPGFKILTYYGTQKERKLKRTGWTKPNAFHICITSYKLVIQDHQSFRRKKWKYLILDEAQNIKNFKSQRWQLLLNFQTQQRLLLTGTPLQNNLMELWSLMHFLMPNVFQSHREFKEWFSNPVAGMIEGNSEYNETIIKRLHKVLRPFLLRRLKCEVEKQMPKKYEHVVMCRLSKRQRFLYDDFMSRAKTRETLATGNLLSVINVLMQLRKVCNHPNLFEVRPTISPFQSKGFEYSTASLVYGLLNYNPLKNASLLSPHSLLINLEYSLRAVDAHRIKKLQTPRRLIEEIDSVPEPAPPCPKGRVRMKVQLGEPREPKPITNATPILKATPKVGTSPIVKTTTASPQQGLKLRFSGSNSTGLQGYSLQLVQQGGVKAILNSTPGQLSIQSKSESGDAVPTSVPQSYAAQIVQTPTGRHILLTSSAASVQQSQLQPISTTVMTPSGQRLAVLSKTPLMCTTVTQPTNSRSVAKLPALSIATSTAQTTQAATPLAMTNHTSVVSTTQPLNAALVQQLMSQQQTPPQTVNNTSAILHNHRTRSGDNLKTDDQDDEREWSRYNKETIEERRKRLRREKLSLMARLNDQRCSVFPLFGADLREACDVFKQNKPKSMTEKPTAVKTLRSWNAAGYTNCKLVTVPATPQEVLWTHTQGLTSVVRTVEDYVNELKPILDRFVFYVPAVQSPAPKFHVSHPPPGKLWEQRRTELVLRHELAAPSTLFHTIARNMSTQFPDPRLIQYDCGKLQTLDKLLRKLKTEGHRVLIFTQMTKMLDVLEAFLNYHGHIYLRLDGTTKVDQRQVLMERFNGDKRIFAFILSTRSGGVGVNLTGADTVIFYDSDWNPTMDAQAQDRCHRIGQTRDVHIYRLVSERTIEENILKKANQKRLLGDLAIEGGNFTTAYFKSSTIQDLFNIDGSEDASTRMAEVIDREKALRPVQQSKIEEEKPESLSEPGQQSGSGNGDERSAMGALESALAACEDEQDVQAARTAKAEAVAELAEFDESIPLEDANATEGGATQTEQQPVPELSRAEMEVQNLIKQLTPIEQYAMRFVEMNEAAWSAQQLAAAEAEIEAQKREWEANRLKAMREEEEARKQWLREEEDAITFSREDATNQVWMSGNEQMPMWCPPTPPQNDTDVYIDHALTFLYEPSVMLESQLPPVYIKKEPKRTRHEAGLADGRRPVKIHRKDESVYAPRSLFDRPSPALMKMRRDMKLQRYRGIVRPPIHIPGMKLPSTSKSQQEQEGVLEWMIHEDMALLQAVQIYQGLQLNLVVISPGHTPNWDFVADFVNNTSRIYRSPKQCKNRYEFIIVPREEGKLLYDTTPKKQKKSKNVYKTPQQTKGSRSMRTSQLYAQDNNQGFVQLMTQRFDVIRGISNKKSPTTKPLLVNSMGKNPKHAAILAQSGVSYDTPPNPVDVAIRRAERIAKERLKNSAAAVANAAVPLAGQQVAKSATVVQQQVAGTSQTMAIQNPAASSQSSQSPGPQVSAAASPPTSVQSPASVASALRAQRITSALTQGSNVVSVAGLTATHLQTPRLIVAGQAVSGVTAKGITTGTLTTGANKLGSTQFHLYRQDLLKHPHLRQLQQNALLQQQGIQASIAGVSKAGVTQVGTTVVSTSQAQMATNVQQMTARAQFIKQVTAANNAAVAAAGGKQTTTRPVSESEVAALIKRQQQLQQQKVLQQAAAQAAAAAQHQGRVAAGTSVQQTNTAAVHAQIFAQAGLQVQQAGAAGTQVATLVKAGGASAVTLPVSGVALGPGGQVKTAGVKATAVSTATQQQIRQLQIHPQILTQRKLPAHTKVAQLAQVTNKALIVQTQKNIPATMTMQQLQQVMRVQGAGQAQLTTAGGAAGAQGQHVVRLQGTGTAQGTTQHVVLAKPGVTRGTASVLPGQHALKQTIQVVTATSAAQALASGIRPQVSAQSTLAGALAGTIKVASSSQQALLSQVSAALQGQPVSVSVRQSGSPVRIQAAGTNAQGTPLVAVSVQQPVQQVTVTSQQSSQQQSSAQGTVTTSDGTQQVYRVLKK